MFRKKKARAESKTNSESASTPDKSLPEAVILVIDSFSRDWCLPGGPFPATAQLPTETDTPEEKEHRIHVFQGQWKDLVVVTDFSTSSGRGQVQVNLASHRDSDQPQRDPTNQRAQIYPHMILVRQLIRQLPPDKEDFTPALYGLAMSGIPAVNSLESCVRTLERPLVYGELWRLHQKLGPEFPLLPLSYYSHQSGMMFTPEPPLIVKVGSAEAGYGKIKCDTSEQLRDVRSLVAIHSDYVTAEKYIERREYDIRVQVIGQEVRAFHRQSAVGSWKGNVGSCVLEEVDLAEYPKYSVWADAVRPICGGLDIYTVDAIHCEDGKDWILEINDSASGFAPKRMEEDMKICTALVLDKLSAHRNARNTTQ